MPLIDDIKNDIQTAKKMRPPRWVWLTWMAFCLPIILLFDHFGRMNMSLPVLNIILVFGLLIALKWKLRRRIWFWCIMIFIAALHVPLILLIPWTTQWVPALAIGAIDSADFCVIIWVLAAVGRLMEGQETTES